MKNNCTLLIDGNWLLISRMSTMRDKFNKSKYGPEEIETHSYMLMDLLAQSINKLINLIPQVDNILYVQDGGSWRKSIEKPELVDVYKGNREYPEDDTDWQSIWTAHDNFVKGLKQNGVTCVKEWDVEGDDWIAHWSHKLNDEGINTLIWSTDRDLQQLVAYNKDTTRWTAWYNSKVLILHKDLDDNNIDMVDFFLRFDESDPFLNDLRNNLIGLGQTVEYINPEDIVISKILCGDSSDNINSVIHVKKAEKYVNVTSRDITNILENYNIKQLLDERDTILHVLSGLKKFSNIHLELSDLSKVFDYNKQLVWLDESVYPDEIKHKLSLHDDEYSVVDMAYIKNNYKVLLGEYNDHAERNALLDLYNQL